MKSTFQTYLIAGSTVGKRTEQALKLRDKHKGKPVDTILVPREDETAIKIEHVREIHQIISRPPLVADVKTVFFLEMERASLETQHALLKLLEEPPRFALIILTAAKKESLLPTILSRATLVKLANEPETLDWTKEFNKLQSILSTDRFSEGSRLETKEEAITWLQTVLKSVRLHLLSHHSPQNNTPLIQFIRKINRALNTLQTTNTHPRLLMENLLLDLPDLPCT